jgi:hypothetical protein
MLCAGLLVQAVQRLESDGLKRAAPKYLTGADGGCVKETAFQRREAKQWVDGGTGTITFEECCEAIGVDPVRARRSIEEHCRVPKHRSKRLRH